MKHFYKYLDSTVHEATKIKESDTKTYENKHKSILQEGKTKGESIQNIQRVK